jgi:hypothetical protein
MQIETNLMTPLKLETRMVYKGMMVVIGGLKCFFI